MIHLLRGIQGPGSPLNRVVRVAVCDQESLKNEEELMWRLWEKGEHAMAAEGWIVKDFIDCTKYSFHIVQACLGVS